MRSGHAAQKREIQAAELAALIVNGVLEEMGKDEMPATGQLLATMWVFGITTDEIDQVQ